MPSNSSLHGFPPHTQRRQRRAARELQRLSRWNGPDDGGLTRGKTWQSLSLAIAQCVGGSSGGREYRKDGIAGGRPSLLCRLPQSLATPEIGSPNTEIAITCAGGGHAPCRLPHAQHALTTFGSSVPHDSCHPLPAVPLDVHHLWALYMLHVPYISLKPGASVHLDEFTRGELPVGLIMS